MNMISRLAVPVLVLAALGGCAKPAEPSGSQPTRRPPGTPSAPVSDEAAGCPEPGVLITADRGDAATGYREMSLHLTNCGQQPFAVTGRPDMVVLGKDREILEVEVVPSVHYTQSPRPVTLAPGQSTTAVMSWRNTYTASDVGPVSGVYLSVAPAPGAPRQLVRPPVPLDLGNTGRLEVSAWL